MHSVSALFTSTDIQTQRVLQTDPVNGGSKHHTSESTETESFSILGLLILIILDLFLFKYINKWKKDGYQFPQFLQKGFLSFCVGLTLGWALYSHRNKEIKESTRQLFEFLFNHMFLPFIILESALTVVSKKHFFSYIGPIVLFGGIGVIVSTLLIGIGVDLLTLGGIISFEDGQRISSVDCFVLSSIISTSDPVSMVSVFRDLRVEEHIYSIVFGESTLNSFVSFTVFEAILSVHHRYQSLISRLFWIVIQSVLSIVLGYSMGLLSAFICKQSNKRMQHQAYNMHFADLHSDGSSKQIGNNRRTGFGTVVIIPWISFLISEALNLSPMLSVFACGIATGQFAMKNLTSSERTTAERIFTSISETCQSASLILVGVAFTGFDIPNNSASLMTIITVFILLAASRGVSVLLASMVCDRFYPELLNDRNKLTIWFSGLRGALACSFGLKCLHHLNDKSAAAKIFSISLWVTGLSIIFNSIFLQIFGQYDEQATPTLRGKAIRSQYFKRKSAFLTNDWMAVLEDWFLSDPESIFSKKPRNKLTEGLITEDSDHDSSSLRTSLSLGEDSASADPTIGTPLAESEGLFVPTSQAELEGIDESEVQKQELEWKRAMKHRQHRSPQPIKEQAPDEEESPYLPPKSGSQRFSESLSEVQPVGVVTEEKPAIELDDKGG